MFQVNKLAVLDHEKGNEVVLSLLQIEAKVKRPHAATIWHYVNTNIAGMSPLKIGVKGGMPMCAFKSLCIAFDSFVRIQQMNSCQGKITYKKLAVGIIALRRHNYRLKML